MDPACSVTTSCTYKNLQPCFLSLRMPAVQPSLAREEAEPQLYNTATMRNGKLDSGVMCEKNSIVKHTSMESCCTTTAYHMRARSPCVVLERRHLAHEPAVVALERPREEVKVVRLGSVALTVPLKHG